MCHAVTQNFCWTISVALVYPTEARPHKAADLDFTLVLSADFVPMTVAARAVASVSPVEKKKANNPFSLSDKAYKVTVDIAHSRLQLTPALAAAANSV